MTGVVEPVVIVPGGVPASQDSASIRVRPIAPGRSAARMVAAEPAGIVEAPRSVRTDNAFANRIVWASFAETTAAVAPAETVPSPCPA